MGPSLTVAFLAGCANVLITNPIWVVATRMQVTSCISTSLKVDQWAAKPVLQSRLAAAARQRHACKAVPGLACGDQCCHMHCCSRWPGRGESEESLKPCCAHRNAARPHRLTRLKEENKALGECLRKRLLQAYQKRADEAGTHAEAPGPVAICKEIYREEGILVTPFRRAPVSLSFCTVPPSFLRASHRACISDAVAALHPSMLSQ